MEYISNTMEHRIVISERSQIYYDLPDLTHNLINDFCILSYRIYPISNFHHKHDLKNEIKRVSKQHKLRRKSSEYHVMMGEIRKYEQKYGIQI